MSNNTSSTVPVSVDLSVTMLGDITPDNLADYVAAFADSVRTDSKITYGRTVVYMAARDMADDENPFVGKDFAEKVGVSPAYVSTLAGLALAVDRGITPHKEGKMSERWAALVQNMSKDVRTALKAKPFTLKAFDAVLFATAEAKKDKRKDDTAKRVANATEPKDATDLVTEGGLDPKVALTVEQAITLLDQSAAFLALSVLTPAQVEKVSDIVSNLAVHLPDVEKVAASAA